MIVKMQEITLLVSQRHTNAALSVLRRLGVVHIEHMRRPQAEHITSLEHKLALLDKALMIIGTPDRQRDDLGIEQIYSYVKEIIGLDNEKQKLILRLKELEKEQSWFDEWGNVSSSTLTELKKAGVFLRLYITTKRSLKSISQDRLDPSLKGIGKTPPLKVSGGSIPMDKVYPFGLVYILKQKQNEVYLAHIGTSEEERLDFAEVLPPAEDLYSLQRKISSASDSLKRINERLEEAASYTNLFLNYKSELLKKLEFCNVRFGMAEDEGICCLEGFCPKEAVTQIRKTADKEGWAFVSRPPDNPQKTPTLIRNPRWIEIIKPIFKFMGTLPGYEEYDISFWFLVFFSLFFAMLIGDAGYGFLFLAATFFLRKKFRSAPKAPFFLMYLLSAATIIWGAVTGTWFGFEQIAQLPLMNSLVIDRMDSFVGTNQIFMIYLCFLIGAVHLSIAHGIIAFRFINSLVSLAQIGWICIVWAAFFVAGGLVLNRPVPDFTLTLGIVGFALVILFGNPQKNIFKGMAFSLADLPLKTIGSFSDIISYLRLFAVGYASVAVATTFNNMAVGSGINNIFAGLIAAAILFLGHSLNIVLGLMAVIVHGIRLNMLEFSGHLNMQWSGKEYRPFKE